MEEAIKGISERSATSSLSSASLKPIVIWLSGHAHTNDKLAMREVGRQLVLQTGSKDLGLPEEVDEDEIDEHGGIRTIPGAEDDDGDNVIQNVASMLVSWRPGCFSPLSQTDSTISVH